jgi:predicted SPOUT superfamily RNA methylase MTH1
MKKETKIIQDICAHYCNRQCCNVVRLECYVLFMKIAISMLRNVTQDRGLEQYK